MRLTVYVKVKENTGFLAVLKCKFARLNQTILTSFHFACCCVVNVRLCTLAVNVSYKVVMSGISNKRVTRKWIKNVRVQFCT